MKNQILIIISITLIIFGCSDVKKSTDEAVTRIKNEANFKNETIDLPCTRVIYKFIGMELKMLTASYGMGDGATDTEFYFENNKLIFCKVIDSSVAMNTNTDGSVKMENVVVEYNYYIENEEISECFSNNVKLDISKIKSYQNPEEIISLSNQLLKAYNSKDSTVLCK